MDGVNTQGQMGNQMSNQTSAPATPNPVTNNNFGSTSPNDNDHKGSAGPIIGSVIVVLIVVLGGLYLYGEQLNQRNLEQVTPEQINSAVDQATTNLEQQGSTDSLTEINADLNATNVENLDSDLDNI